MGTKRRILLHLAAALAGWGIVHSQHPSSSDAEQPIAPGKSSIREALDREAGEKLLRRLTPDLAPAPPLEVIRHEGTVEERAYLSLLNSIYPANPSTPDGDAITAYLRDQIRAALSGEVGPELSYAFLHGRLEAPRILETLSQTYPDLAKEPLFARAVFLELFQIDPTRAAVLLDGLPAAERASWLEDGIANRSALEFPYGTRIYSYSPSNPESWSFDEVRHWQPHPRTALAWSNLALSQAPAAQGPFTEKDMTSLAVLYHEKFGNEYTGWLLDQPPSKTRGMMLNVWVKCLEHEDPAAATTLRKRLSTR